MKSLILAFIAIAISVNFTFANSILPGKTVVEGKVLTLDLHKYASHNVTISIYDMDGNEIHNEEVNAEEYTSRSYNLKNFPTGKYYFSMDMDQRIVTKNIEIAKSSIYLLDEKVSYKPNVQIKDNRWNVNLLAQNQTAHVTIYNKTETLYQETFKNQMSIFKSYDMKNLESGKYYITIEIDNKTYTETFTK